MCISLKTGFVGALKTNNLKQPLKQRMMWKNCKYCGKGRPSHSEIFYISISDNNKIAVIKKCKKMGISTRR